VNATEIRKYKSSWALITRSKISQFPLWDFGECNMETGLRFSEAYNLLSLNSLCGISVNATNLDTHIVFLPKNLDSQFPLWDFGECNSLTTLTLSINHAPSSSQFPLWDFGECNRDVLGRELCPRCNTLNSLCGISVNATDAVSAVFRGIGGENQRVLPLTPLLQQAL
jgi:hypothetical protein